MIMDLKRWTGFLAALLLSVPVLAAEPLPAQPGKAWTHRHSGIVVPATLAGTPRTKATSFAADELDVGLSFDTEKSRESLTVYIYRNTNGSVPVWFAQSQWSLENRDIFKGLTLAMTPSAFTPPGQRVASGLIAVYDLKGAAGYKSSGVALFSSGDWYVKVRATSTARSPADTASWINGVIAELRIPASEGVAAAPVAACPSPLAFGTGVAGDVKAAAKLGAGVTAPAVRISGTTWCSDAALGGNRRVYRPVGTADRYLIAVGDNGNAFAVRGEGAYYSINYVSAGEVTALAPRDRLPKPEQIFELVDAERIGQSFVTWPPR